MENIVKGLFFHTTYLNYILKQWGATCRFKQGSDILNLAFERYGSSSHVRGKLERSKATGKLGSYRGIQSELQGSELRQGMAGGMESRWQS